MMRKKSDKYFFQHQVICQSVKSVQLIHSISMLNLNSSHLFQCSKLNKLKEKMDLKFKWITLLFHIRHQQYRRLCPGNFRKFLLRPQRKESLEFMIICQLSLERKSSSRTSSSQQRHCDEQKASAFIGSGHKQILWTSRVSILFNNIN